MNPILALEYLPANGAWAFLFRGPNGHGQLIRMHEWRLLFATRDDAVRAAVRCSLTVHPETGVVGVPE